MLTYSVFNSLDKKQKVIKLLNNNAIISTQAVNVMHQIGNTFYC